MDKLLTTKKKILIGLLFLFFLYLPLGKVNALPDAQSEREKVIILFKEIPEPEVIIKQGGTVKIKFNIIPAIAAEVPKEAILALEKEPSVKLIEPDYIISAFPIEREPKVPRSYESASENSPVDPAVAARWNLKSEGINAEAAWSNYSVNGNGIKIAILDTGVDYTAADLDKNYLGGYDFVNSDNDPKDDNDHGTFVASVSVGEGEEKIVGAAYDSSYYALKVLDRKGDGYVSDVISGIEWATTNGADIISMSFGGYDYSSAFELAVNNSYASGTVLVAASGNEGYDYSAYPAAFAKVISVGAHAQDQTIPSWSNGAVDLVAPGVYVVSMDRNGVLWYVSGTSIATPHVSAEIALEKQYANIQSKSFNNSYYWQTIKQSALSLGYPVSRQGEGKGNTDKAVNLQANNWYLDYSVAYLDYALIYNGLPAYYIGQDMHYQINVTNNQDKSIKNLKITAIQAYYGHQGDSQLPGTSTEEFLININPGETITLDDYYSIPVGTYAGNDRTELIFEIDSYQPRAIILRNATAGLWCPPNQ